MEVHILIYLMKCFHYNACYIVDGHMLGYAFVQYTSVFDARKAMKAVNNTKIKGNKIIIFTLI